MLQIIREFIFELVIPDARPARTVTQRVARLDHKFGYYAMEEHTIVVPAPRMADEVFYRLGSLLREQTQVHITQRRMDRGGRRERCRTRRRSGWRCGCDGLLLSCWALIEYVSVTGFRTAVSVNRRGSVGIKADTGKKGR